MEKASFLVPVRDLDRWGTFHRFEEGGKNLERTTWTIERIDPIGDRRRTRFESASNPNVSKGRSGGGDLSRVGGMKSREVHRHDLGKADRVPRVGRPRGRARGSQDRGLDLRILEARFLSSMSPSEDRRRIASGLFRLTLLVVIVGTAIALTGLLQGIKHPDEWLQWFEENQEEGSVLFIVSYSLSTVLLVPGVIFNLFAGMAFSLWWGSLCTWVGTVLGQTFAFLAARYLLRDLVVSMTSERYRKWSAVDEAICRESWKVVVLLRLSIIIPYNFLNYVLGASSVGFVPYTVASALGVIPSTILFVYIGSITRDISRVVSGEVSVTGPLGLLLTMVGLAVLVLSAWYIAQIAKKAIEEVVGKDLEEIAEDTSEAQNENSDEGVSLLPI